MLAEGTSEPRPPPGPRKHGATTRQPFKVDVRPDDGCVTNTARARVRPAGRRSGRPGRGAVATTIAAVVVSLASGGAARAESVPSAQAAAAALRTELISFEQQADRAVEQYDLAEGELGKQVTAEVGLQRDVTDAQGAARAAGRVQASRARALYQSGGMPPLYASVLASGDIREVIGRSDVVTRLLVADRTTTAKADAATSRLAGREHLAHAAAAATVRKTGQVAAIADRITALLSRQRALISNADSHILELVHAQEAAANAAAATQFQAQLAAAQAGADAGQGAGPRGLVAGPSAPDIPAPTPAVATVIAIAKQQLGKPYVCGAVGPDSFDCSGFTGYAYAAAGIAFSRTAAQQYLAGPHPSLAQLQPGDLLFWATDLSNASSIDHMAMYLGAGLMIVAPHTGDVVRISKVYANGYFGATRVDPRVSGSVAGPQWSDTGRAPGH